MDYGKEETRSEVIGWFDTSTPSVRAKDRGHKVANKVASDYRFSFISWQSQFKNLVNNCFSLLETLHSNAALLFSLHKELMRRTNTFPGEKGTMCLILTRDFNHNAFIFADSFIEELDPVEDKCSLDDIALDVFFIEIRS